MIAIFQMKKPLVVIESPFAGDIGMNVAYARAAMADSLGRGEAPLASHLLYTQPGVLRDEVPAERELGIETGLDWGAHADLAVFYTDLGWSQGMKDARKHWERLLIPFEIRRIPNWSRG